MCFQLVLIIFFKIKNITLDPDPNWPKFWIRMQIPCIWIHNTVFNPTLDTTYKKDRIHAVHILVYCTCYIIIRFEIFRSLYHATLPKQL